MNIRTGYLILCIAGFVLPYSQFLPWAAAHGLDASLFTRELFSNRIGGFFGLDVIISACVLVSFVVSEGRRLNMSRLWLPVIGTLLVGVSFGLPLFLYMRQARVDDRDNAIDGRVRDKHTQRVR
jgi:hypothetical protein